MAEFRALGPVEAGCRVVPASATLDASEPLVLPLHRVARLERPQQVHSVLFEGLVFQSLLRITFFIVGSELCTLDRILLLQGLQLAAPAVVARLVSTQFLQPCCEEKIDILPQVIGVKHARKLVRIRQNHIRHATLAEVLVPLAEGKVAVVQPLIVRRRRQRVMVASVRGEDLRARDWGRALAEPLVRGSQALAETVLLALF